MSGEGVKSNSNGIKRVGGIRIMRSVSTVPLADSVNHTRVKTAYEQTT